MKPLLIATAFICMTVTQAQQDIFGDWHATEMFIDGQNIPVPTLSSLDDVSCMVGISVVGTLGGGDVSVDTSLCFPCQFEINTLTTDEFDVFPGGVACLGEPAVCYEFSPPSFQQKCDQSNGELKIFQDYQNEFYSEEDITFSYDIQQLANNSYQLTVENPKGDYIIYNSEQVLSMGENLLNSVTLHPNPTSGLVHIQAPTGFEPQTAVLYDMQGKRLSSHSGDLTAINLSHLQAGVYFLQLERDGQTVVKKLVKATR